MALAACNAERVEIADPPAESTSVRPPPRPVDDDVPFVAPPVAPSAAPPAPPAPNVRTVGSLGGLVDFDFDEASLVLVGEDGAYRCALDACTAPQRVPGLRVAAGSLALAAGRVFFDDARADDDHVLASVKLDGTERRTEATYAAFTARATFFSFHGGDSVHALLRRTPIADAGRFEHVFLSPPARAENGARIGRVTANVHTNGGARIQSIPAERPSLVASVPWSFAVIGAVVPAPASEPLAVGTSPFAGVAHPAVVVRRGGSLEACPIVNGRCERWIDLGARQGTFALDADRLYVGGETGLFACALAELARTRACTFDLVVDEPVSAPLYVTATELFFVHGSDVRAARKLPN